MIRSKNFGSRLFDAANHTFLVLLCLSMIYPFLLILSKSLSDPQAIIDNRVILWPIGFNLEAYKLLFKYNDILVAYKNSIFYAILGTLSALVMGCLGAYPLSEKKFRMRTPVTVFFTITMIFTGGMIPSYIMMNKIGLMNSIWAFLLPPAFSVWNIIILRTSFSSIPYSLRESGYMDGASDMRILLQIIIPMSKAILATIALFSLVSQWNNFVGPFIYLNDKSKYSLPLILRRILLQEQGLRADPALFGASVANRGILEGLKMATIIVTIGPIIFAYPFLQKYFTKGVMIGSVKG